MTLYQISVDKQEVAASIEAAGSQIPAARTIFPVPPIK